MKKFSVFLICLFVALSFPATVFAYSTVGDVSSFEDENLVNELGVSVPTFKYSASYTADYYALDTDTPMYVYIVVDWQYLDYVTFSENGFEMSQGECSLIQYNPNSKYVGRYAHITCTSKDDFISQLDNLVPRAFFAIDKLLAYYIPEQSDGDSIDLVDIKVNNILMSELNSNLSELIDNGYIDNTTVFTYKEKFYICLALISVITISSVIYHVVTRSVKKHDK